VLSAGNHDDTLTIEALCRYLRCQPGELIELHPPLEEEPRHHVNELYPPRARPTDG